MGYVSVRIGPNSPIRLILPNHFHVGTLNNEIVSKRKLSNSGTRSWCNDPSARPDWLVIGVNDDHSRSSHVLVNGYNGGHGSLNYGNKLANRSSGRSTPVLLETGVAVDNVFLMKLSAC
ncbi:hypothetical protein CTI12_AA272980 [Artemisia annua]|uniref:Uncharacterized protein n=1 Tax=Artemisia annua TaxID=35608 RepID=A0A2U1NEK0_ARTAN|nr:hypothetical protein CTI12_AA272980 [Artemisia annua]